MVWSRLSLSYLCLLTAVAFDPAAVSAQCLLCAPTAVAPKPKTAQRPLRIEIDTILDFATAARLNSGAGTIDVDSDGGGKRISGALVGLGGSALRGTVVLTGEPFARVTIMMPRQIKLTSTQGTKADVTDIRSTLPLDPALDADGRLMFSFGGRLSVEGGATGSFHGQVHISANYQ
ncbi:MAG: DUF4402 domain-containing protein [Sphingomonadaceae bacterium]